MVFLAFLNVSCNTNKIKLKSEDDHKNMLDTLFFKNSYGDQSIELQKILNTYSDVIIKLEREKEYFFSDIFVNSSKRVIIMGNNSRILPAKKYNNNSIFTFVDIGVVKIVNCTLSGGYPTQNVDNFLVKVHTPKNITQLVHIENVDFIDGSGGGIKIQNIHNKYENWNSGAKNIFISNCKFINYGLDAACSIRGSHKNVHIENCFASDPLGRQEKGHVFDITAEVDIIDDCVGNVEIQNVKMDYIRLEGIFIQKVKRITVDGFNVRYIGLDINGGSYINNAMKIDDLGLSNRAIIKNVTVENSGEKAFAGIAIEESPGQGHTSHVILDNVNSDRLIRLGASGNHTIQNSTIQNSELQFLSNDNRAKNIIFKNDVLKKSVYFAQFRDNSLLDCEFTNALIEIGPEAQNIHLEQCSLNTSFPAVYFIAIVLNNPQKPNIVSIKNCSTPENIFGIWSGGLPELSKNIELTISNRNRSKFQVHHHLLKESRIKYD